jgi:hypothetical protein
MDKLLNSIKKEIISLIKKDFNIAIKNKKATEKKLLKILSEIDKGKEPADFLKIIKSHTLKSEKTELPLKVISIKLEGIKAQKLKNELLGCKLKLTITQNGFSIWKLNRIVNDFEEYVCIKENLPDIDSVMHAIPDGYYLNLFFQEAAITSMNNGRYSPF